MGFLDGIKASYRNKAAQRNREKMAYKEVYNEQRVALQKKKATIDAKQSLGLNNKGTGYVPKPKKKYTSQSFGGSSFGNAFAQPSPKERQKKKNDSGFTYGGEPPKSGFTYGGFK